MSAVGSKNLKRAVVRGLNRACTWVDDVAYRPVVVRLTARLPRAWNCQLAHLSMALDDRWGTGYWQSELAPAAPNGPCAACRRRAAWLVVGGADPEDGESRGGSLSYLDRHPVELCGWCRLDTSLPVHTREEVERMLAEAGARSIGWRWRR